MKSNRREFLSSTALLAGGLASHILTRGSESSAQNRLPGAEPWNPDPGVRKEDDKLLNIGGVFGLWSHTSSTWWRYLNPPEGYVRATGMRITHLWCVDREAGRRLAKRYDAELVDNYDDMVGEVSDELEMDASAAETGDDPGLPGDDLPRDSAEATDATTRVAGTGGIQ